MKKVLSLLLVLSVFTVSAQQFDAVKFDKYLHTLEENEKAMLSVAVVEKGKPIYQHSIGFADVPSKQNANKDTQYRIGSITKVFTSVMIFQLIDEGKLSLDTTLATFYPNVKKADEITISMLLNHKSGIHNFTNIPEYLEYMTEPKTKAELANIIESMESDFAPNSRASYSNSGYVLLGFIVEDITNDSYAQQLQKRICRKLGLSKTVYGSAINTKDNQANSYVYGTSGWSPATMTDMSIPYGAGAIISTPTEVAVFFSNLFNGKLISAASLTKMKEIEQGFGRGLFQFPFYEKQAYGHNGGIDGFSSVAAYFEEDELAISLTANGMNFPMNEITVATLSSYYGRDYDIPNFDQKAIELSKKDLEHYEGVFASKDVALKITLDVKNGQLTAQATGQSAFNLTPYSSSEFRFDPAGVVILFENGANTVDYSTFQLHQGSGRFRFVRE